MSSIMRDWIEQLFDHKIDEFISQELYIFKLKIVLIWFCSYYYKMYLVLIIFSTYKIVPFLWNILNNIISLHNCALSLNNYALSLCIYDLYLYAK